MRWLGSLFAYGIRLIRAFVLLALSFLAALWVSTLVFSVLIVSPYSDVEQQGHGYLEKHAIALAPGEFERMLIGALERGYYRYVIDVQHFQIYFSEFGEGFPSYLFFEDGAQSYVALLPLGYKIPCFVIPAVGIGCPGISMHFDVQYQGLNQTDDLTHFYSLVEGNRRNSDG